MNSFHFSPQLIQRRLFLHRSSAAALALAVPGVMAKPAAPNIHLLVDPIPEQNTPIHVLGMGPVGVQMVIDLEPDRLPGFVSATGWSGGSCKSRFPGFDNMRQSLSGKEVAFVLTAFDDDVSISLTPHLARGLRESGALTISLVSGSSACEAYTDTRAHRAILELEAASDALIIVPTTPATSSSGSGLSKDTLLDKSEALSGLVGSISGALNPPFAGLIDREDLRHVLKAPGKFSVVAERASGPKRAEVVARTIQKRLTGRNRSADGAISALVLIGFGTAFPKLGDSKSIMNALRPQFHSDSEVHFAMYSDPALRDDVHVTLICPGFA